MKLYTALDVSLRSVAICVVDEQGEVRREAKVEADVDRIVLAAITQSGTEDRRLRSGYADAVSDVWIARSRV